MADITETMIRKATISPCGTYRYRLTRYWGPGPFATFVMLNPSTADAEIDDPTIRRCMGFARREGWGGIVVANLYALRATNPDALARHPDPIGPNNGDHLFEAAAVSEATGVPVIAAWGARAPSRGQQVASWLREQGAILMCLGKTKDGHPRHPLYVRGDQPLEAL